MMPVEPQKPKQQCKRSTSSRYEKSALTGRRHQRAPAREQVGVHVGVRRHGNAYLRPHTSLISSIWISWISTNLSHW